MEIIELRANTRSNVEDKAVYALLLGLGGYAVKATLVRTPAKKVGFVLEREKLAAAAEGRKSATVIVVVVGIKSAAVTVGGGG